MAGLNVFAKSSGADGQVQGRGHHLRTLCQKKTKAGTGTCQKDKLSRIRGQRNGNLFLSEVRLRRFKMQPRTSPGIMPFYGQKLLSHTFRGKLQPRENKAYLSPEQFFLETRPRSGMVTPVLRFVVLRSGIGSHDDENRSSCLDRAPKTFPQCWLHASRPAPSSTAKKRIRRGPAGG